MNIQIEKDSAPTGGNRQERCFAAFRVNDGRQVETTKALLRPWQVRLIRCLMGF